MEYRGIRYTVRARIERDQWVIAIHPEDVESAGKVINGNREEAEIAGSLHDQQMVRAASMALKESRISIWALPPTLTASWAPAYFSVSFAKLVRSYRAIESRYGDPKIG